MRINFTIEALDNLSVSQSHAGVFCENSLDYIPGSALLGAFASCLYPKLSEDDAWKMFQNGDVKFSNCYPLFINEENNTYEQLLPVPFALHYEKQAGGYEEALKANKVVNCFKKEIGQNQLKQLRSGYIRSNGYKASGINSGSSVKTAINPDTQSASEHQLFVTGYIRIGTYFSGYIDGNDDLITKILKVIDSSNGVFRIGKSRGSEFGRVQLKVRTKLSTHQDVNEQISGNGKELVLWCISDVVFYDADVGMPSAVPLVSNLLWSKDISGSYQHEKSFIRNSSLRFFNRKRGGYDGEKILVKKGSIISFSLIEELSQDDLKLIAREGIGIDRQMGFGQVQVNPKWLINGEVPDGTDRISLFTPVSIPANQLYDHQVYKSFDTRLVSWIDSKVELERKWKEAHLEAERINDQIYDIYKSARSYNNLDANSSCGPSSTQLRRVYEFLKNKINSTNKYKKVDENVINEIGTICEIKTDFLGWGIKVPQGENGNILCSDFMCIYLSLIRERTYEGILRHIEMLTKDDPSKWEDLKKHIDLQ